MLFEIETATNFKFPPFPKANLQRWTTLISRCHVPPQYRKLPTRYLRNTPHRQPFPCLLAVLISLGLTAQRNKKDNFFLWCSDHTLLVLPYLQAGGEPMAFSSGHSRSLRNTSALALVSTTRGIWERVIHLGSFFHYCLAYFWFPTVLPCCLPPLKTPAPSAFLIFTICFNQQFTWDSSILHCLKWQMLLGMTILLSEQKITSPLGTGREIQLQP